MEKLSLGVLVLVLLTPIGVAWRRKRAGLLEGMLSLFLLFYVVISELKKVFFPEATSFDFIRQLNYNYLTVLSLLMIGFSQVFRKSFQPTLPGFSTLKRVSISSTSAFFLLASLFFFNERIAFLHPNLVIPMMSLGGLFTVFLIFCQPRTSFLKQLTYDLILISIILFGFLRTGALSFVFTAGIPLFITAFVGKDQKRKILCIFFLATAIFAQGLKPRYRMYLIHHPAATFVEKVERLFGLAEKDYKLTFQIPQSAADEANAISPRNYVSYSIGRIGDDSLMQVLEKKEALKNFYLPGPYVDLSHIFVPRFLWSEKPERNFWNRFGRQMGVISKDDLQTSVALGFVAEGYLRFGMEGVLFTAAILALVLYALECFLAFYLNSIDYRFVATLLPLVSLSLDMTSFITCLIHGIAIWWIALIVLTKSGRPLKYLGFVRANL